MTRYMHNDLQGYDDKVDTWFQFDSAEAGAVWIASDTDAPSDGVNFQTKVIEVAPAFNAYNIGVTVPAATLVGPVVQLCQGDQGRFRLLVNWTALSGTHAGSYLIVGTREAVTSGQGIPLTSTSAPLELKNTMPVWAALVLGTATGPLTGLAGVLTESLVG